MRTRQRARKVEQFVRAKEGYSYSSGLTLDLLNSARALLLSAAQEHGGPRYRDSTNHSAQHAPGAIILSVAAFELFLNYLLVGLAEVPDAGMQELLNKGTIAKVDVLTKRFDTKCTCRSDLKMAIEIRNEIAHHFPRPGKKLQNLPGWYAAAERMGLFIQTGTENDFDLGQKLASYNLARWVAAIVVKAVGEMLNGSSHSVARRHAFEVENFATLTIGIPG